MQRLPKNPQKILLKTTCKSVITEDLEQLFLHIVSPMWQHKLCSLYVDPTYKYYSIKTQGYETNDEHLLVKSIVLYSKVL